MVTANVLFKSTIQYITVITKVNTGICKSKTSWSERGWQYLPVLHGTNGLLWDTAWQITVSVPLSEGSFKPDLVNCLKKLLDETFLNQWLAMTSTVNYCRLKKTGCSAPLEGPLGRRHQNVRCSARDRHPSWCKISTKSVQQFRKRSILNRQRQTSYPPVTTGETTEQTGINTSFNSVSM